MIIVTIISLEPKKLQMKLNKLLNQIDYKGDISSEIDIENITYDSRNVNNQSCFVAIKGEKFDGHNFISEAFKKGAKIIDGMARCSVTA